MLDCLQSGVYTCWVLVLNAFFIYCNTTNAAKTFVIREFMKMEKL